MNELKIISDTLTMSSREIAELTGKNHADVMRDIRNISNELGQSIFAESSYINSQNKQQPEYLLNKENTLLLVSGYSVSLRQAIIRRWQDLEAKQQHQLPQTYKEALIALVAQVEINEEQQKVIDYQKPRVDFANTVMQAEKDITLRQLAGLLNIKGLGQNNMAKALRDIEFFMPDTVLPYRVHIEHGRCRLTEKTRIDTHGNIQVYFTTSFTNKGLNYIRRCLENKLGLKPQHVGGSNEN